MIDSPVGSSTSRARVAVRGRAVGDSGFAFTYANAAASYSMVYARDTRGSTPAPPGPARPRPVLTLPRRAS